MVRPSVSDLIFKHPEYLNTWSQAQVFFDTHFVDKKVVYEYKDKNSAQQEIVIEFRKSNLMHLLGVEYKEPKNSRYTAGSFWASLAKRKLNLKLLNFTNDPMQSGMTTPVFFGLKMQALQSVNDLISLKVRVSENRDLPQVWLDIMVRSNRRTIGLGLQFDNDANVYRVISTLNMHKFDNVVSYPVTKLKSIDRSGIEKIYFENKPQPVKRFKKKRRKNKKSHY